MTEMSFPTAHQTPIDALAAQGPAARAFLRERWFAANGHASPRMVTMADGADRPIAALALTERRKGPFSLREIGGCYWPFRGVPLAPQVSAETLAEGLARHRGDLGHVWRLGPAEQGDAALASLCDAARRAGWHVLTRPLGQVFELDLAGCADGDTAQWPSSKTQRKNRWRKRRLEEEGGPLRIEFFTGADWTAQQRDALAEIEAKSWLGTLAEGGDTKFRDPAMRAYWEALCADPVLAHMLTGSLMWIGERPAAFTFGLQTGTLRYCIANNFDQSFTRHGPGRVLLYDDFARAAEQGVTRISWGLGDAGYKSEMGAQPGAHMVDLLFVRGALLAAVLKRWWQRTT